MSTLSVCVKKKKIEAEDIVSFELADILGKPLPPFSAGSHVEVHIPGGFTRHYSLCNDPSDQHRYRIAVLREPTSRGGSIAMHEQVAEGDVIQISEPKNLFPLVHAKRFILFAGGIGITPILCMAERLEQIGADFVIHYCSRSAPKMAFREYIASSKFRNKVRFHLDDSAQEQKLNAAAVLDHVSNDTHIYVCGPAGFIEYILRSAKEAGWPEENVHREYFAAGPQSSTSTRSFDVKLASTGQRFTIPPEKTVIEILAQNGVDVPVLCGEGVCGTCITRILEGVPEHKDVCLTDAEHQRNDQFTPCCSRSQGPLLVLDL